MPFGSTGGAIIIDVIVADHQELFRIGMAEVLAVSDDVRIVGQPQSSEQLLSALKTFSPHILVLSTCRHAFCRRFRRSSGC